jgi:hypothetical protein
MDFTSETHALSRAVGKRSSTSEEIEALLSEVSKLYQGLAEYDREAEASINAQDLEPEKVMAAVQSYMDHYRSIVLPRVPKLYERIVAASNTRNDEASHYLDVAKAQAERAGKISIFLYVLGSCLALTGQTIEKTKPKDDKTRQQQAASDTTVPNHAMHSGSAGTPPASTAALPSPTGGGTNVTPG